MELKQLEYFVACADIGSFTKAAELLYVNQSSVSRPPSRPNGLTLCLHGHLATAARVEYPVACCGVFHLFVRAAV